MCAMWVSFVLATVEAGSFYVKMSKSVRLSLPDCDRATSHRPSASSYLGTQPTS